MKRAKEQKRKIIKSMCQAISWLRMARIDILEKKIIEEPEYSEIRETVEELKKIKTQLEAEMKDFINEIDKAIRELE